MKKRLLDGRNRVVLAMILNGFLYALALIPSFFDISGSPASIRAGIVGFGLIGTLVISWSQMVAPYLSKQRQYATKVMDVVVADFLQNYRQLKPSGPQLRMNVMVANRRGWYWPFGDKILSIQYSRGSYSEGELALEYSVGSGSCGRAIEWNRMVIYDRNPEPGKADEDLNHFNMSGIQKDVTRDVRSVLSIPFYRPDDDQHLHPIGVLNIDSVEGGLEQTGFDEVQVQNLAITAAGLTGILYE